MAEPTSSLPSFSMTNDQIMNEVYETHIPGDENYNVESILNVAETTIEHSTQIAHSYLLKGTSKSIEFAKDKPVPEDLSLPLSKIKQIGYQMTRQLAHDQDHAHETAMAILYELRNCNWDAKAAITLAAFAMEYGNFWHQVEVQAKTAPPLEKSLALLSGGSDINSLRDMMNKHSPAFDEFHNLVKLILQIIRSIVELKKLSEVGVDQGEEPELLEALQEIPLDVYWVIITLVVCATHIGALLDHSKHKIELGQFAKKLSSVHTNLTEHVKKIREKPDKFLHLREDTVHLRALTNLDGDIFHHQPKDTFHEEALFNRKAFSNLAEGTFRENAFFHQPANQSQQLRGNIIAFPPQALLARAETKATSPKIIFGEKKNNFSYGKAAVDPTGYEPARPSDIVYPLGKSSFPDDFIFGTATSAYQIEGAIHKRGPSAWDDFTHNYPDKIKDGSNGDIACDSCHRYEKDIQLMKEVGARAYRFSISWSRILKNGKLGSENQEGIQFYKKLLRSLKEKGLIPFVTLFHVDRPQDLEDEYGGFLSDKMIHDFKNFAELCFKEFGHWVKHWITFNEPHIYCLTGYVDGSFAPAHNSNPGTEPYQVAHHILRAHAEAVDVYKRKYKARQNGEIGMTLDSIWAVPMSEESKDRNAAFRALDFILGWFLEPLTTGNYPETMQSRVGKRLPKFSPDVSQKLRESCNFIGINYYTSMFAADYSSKNPDPSYITDSGVDLKYWRGKHPIGERTASGMYSYPKGVRDLLCYIQERYSDPSIYITENGIATYNQRGLPLEGVLLDVPRIRYHNEHLYYVLAASKEGVNIKGYFAWSLLDNFEWNQGYTLRFGMYFVDFKNNKRRHRKLSARWFKLFLEN